MNMKKLAGLVGVLVWLLVPGKAKALSLGCDLPGYETEDYHDPEVEHCVKARCLPSKLIKYPWGLCDEGYAWWIQELLDCVIEGGHCYGFYGGGTLECEGADEGGWPDPWEDTWGWCSLENSSKEVSS